MSLQRQLSRSVPVDTAHVGRMILPETNLYRQIGDQFDALFPSEDEYAAMYAPDGRGAISPLLLSLVTVFQMMEKASDRVAAEMVVSRIDWKYALHLPLGYQGFHFTDLSAFRLRLLENQQERILFDQLLCKLQAMGLLKGRGKVRSDSTHVLALVERLGQFELVTESIRMALAALHAQASAWVAHHLPAPFQEHYGQRLNIYGLSQTQVRAQLIQAGSDGHWLLRQLDQSAPAEICQLPQVQILRQVLAQQFPQGPGQPPAAKRPAGKTVIESPHEPEARAGSKRDKHWQGYKAQLTETCDADRPPLIVDVEPTNALDQDSPQLPAIQQRLEQSGLRPAEQYVDQAYISAEHLAESAQRGIALLGPPPQDTHPDTGFRQSTFQVDEAAQQVYCPQGQTSALWHPVAATAQRAAHILVRFPAHVCQACPAFGVCTRSRRGRSLELHADRARLIQYRQLAQTEEFRQKLHIRAGVEATFSELVRKYGFRFARYRGLARLRLQLLFTAVAANLARLVRWWNRQAEEEGHAPPPVFSSFSILVQPSLLSFRL